MPAPPSFEELVAEGAAVLRPGGRYFSQQVGAGSNRELTDFLMGPQPVSRSRSPRRAVAGAEATGTGWPGCTSTSPAAAPSCAIPGVS